jgi:hypothetical protein
MLPGRAPSALTVRWERPHRGYVRKRCGPVGERPTGERPTEATFTSDVVR